jgi:hypothetical protein
MMPCLSCKGRGWHHGDCHPREVCGACDGTGYGPGVFMLHPGIGSIAPYWELCDAGEPVIHRLFLGEVRKAGIIIAIPALPAAWMPGRFLALVPDEASAAVERLGGSGSNWAEVTGQVEIDLERGLAACPEWLRERYRKTATEAVL